MNIYLCTSICRHAEWKNNGKYNFKNEENMKGGWWAAMKKKKTEMEMNWSYIEDDYEKLTKGVMLWHLKNAKW